MQVTLQDRIRMEGNLAQQCRGQEDEQEPDQMQQDRLDLSAIGYQRKFSHSSYQMPFPRG